MYEFSILKFDGDKSPKTSEAYFWHKADMKIKEEMWVTQRQWRQNKTSERDKDREREKGKRGGGWGDSGTQRKPWEVRKYDGRWLQSKINKDLNITLRNSPIREYEDRVFKIIVKGYKYKMILKGSPNFEKKQELKKERTEKKNRGRTYQGNNSRKFPKPQSHQFTD